MNESEGNSSGGGMGRERVIKNCRKSKILAFLLHYKSAHSLRGEMSTVYPVDAVDSRQKTVDRLSTAR